MTDTKHEMVRNDRTVPTHAESEERQIAPRYEVIESETGYTLKLEMPGVSKESLEIQADRETLTVRGHRHESFDQLTPVLVERPRSEYYREFSMDDTVDWEKTTASVVDGIVIIEIPKASHATPRRIQVK